MRRFLVAIALIFGIVSFGATASYALSSGYTELQYIVTNNDAYIITDLMVNDFDRITSRLTMYDNTSDVAGNGHAVLFGSSTSTTAGSQQGKVFKLYDPSSCSNRGGMTAGYNNLWVGSWSNTALCKTTPLNTPIDVDVKIASGSQWIKIDGTTYGSNSQTAGTLNNSYPVTLFALNYAGVIKGIPHLACESVVFYSGNTMVRNLVPAKRNSDNAIGMYDTVSNTFYASSTSSPFIAGPVAGQSSTATISYVMNGGTNYSGAPTSYYIGVGATIDGTPTKSGNAFAGWCTDSALANCAMTQTISTSDTGNKTFYAKWADVYAITYVLNGGTNYNGAPTSYELGTGATINGVPTKASSVFAGWCTDSNLTSCAMSQTIGTSETTAKTFYAKWTECQACATTNASCTPNVVNNTCVYATVCNANYGNIQNNGAYNASCSLNSYTISYVMDGGTNYTGAPESYTYGTGATINGTPTKYSNLFAGWCTDSELTNCAMSHTISPSDTGNKTFYAKWTVLSSYNINYVLGYGDYVSPRPAYDNAVVPDGYTPTEYIEQTATVKNDTSTIKLDFSGYGTWIIDAQGTGIGATNYNPILVSYEPNTNQTGWFGANPSRYWGAGDNLANFLTRSIINTTFSAGRQDVVINGTITQTYTGSVVTLANWRLFNHSTNPMLVKVFSAKFTQNDELKFNGIPVRRDSDNVCGLYDTVRGIFFTSSAKTNFTCPNAREPDKYTAGTGKEITFVPTRPGMEFLGWCTDSALTNCSMNPVISTNATGNKTFYANWSGYEIDYVTNGGDVYNTLSVPSDYTPVEYIQTNGYSYRNTGIKGLNAGTWEIYAKWMLTQTPRVSDSYVIGTDIGNNNVNAHRIATSGFRSDYYNLNGNSKNAGSGTAGATAFPNQIHEGTIKDKSVVIDEHTFSTTTAGSAINANTPIMLFAQNASAVASGFIGRMYASWATKDGVKQYNYIPVRRNSDGMCGMWDTVSQTFKPSSSGTPFTCPNTAISTPSRYTVGVQTTITAPPESRFGTFAGWCTDSALQNCAMTQTIPTNATGNKVFYAKWNCNDGYHLDSSTHECVPNTITINFLNGGHGTAPESTTCEYGNEVFVTMPAAIDDATGYTFRAWKVNDRWLNAGSAHLCTKEVFGVTSGTVNITADWYECIDPGDGTCQNQKFTVTTTPLPADADTVFKFSLSAKGTFYVDWGDGSSIQTITRDNVTAATYTHTYSPGGSAGDDPVSYTIRFAGVATAYSTTETVATISFFNGTRANRWSAPTASGTEQYIAGISGSLGALFPTLGSSNGQQPRFYQTFTGATNLTGTIPAGLFTGVSGTPATYMFSNTFSYCPGLTGSIPKTLFSGIRGAPAKEVFYRTFSGCTGLTGTIPENLFSGLIGTPADNTFGGVFQNCSGLTGSIPEGLFSGLSGAPKNYVFDGVFENCTGLTGSIPAMLFAGIRGAPAIYMFRGTFSGCSGLTGDIPGMLFAGISGAPAQSMFQNTFRGCTNLSGYVPPNLFANITVSSATDMMTNMFTNSGLAETCPTGTQEYSTGFNSYYAPKVSCGPEADSSAFTTEKFTVTVNMPANTAFKFAMSAKGEFHVDWGDGTFQDIMRDTVVETTYQHTYTTAGSYQIKFYGIPTEYSTANVAAIRFFNGTRANDYSAPTASGTEQYITGISGSLGALFPTINTGEVNGQQPRFYQTFTGATNLTGSIPANLFAGITGKPVSYMFHNTFSWCPGLTGSIPAGLFSGLNGAPAAHAFFRTFSDATGLSGSIPETLFSGIRGAPAASVFGGTFINCTSLTGSIPAGLFSGISGAPASGMFNATFYGASGLTGPIPETLFNGISGAPAANMFNGTFTGCSGLTGSIPANLFSGISGAPADAMFKNVFRDCTGLSGSIPGGLFGKIYGASKASMFQSAFENCTGLEGYIPWDLFSLVSTISSNGAATGYVNLTGNATDKFTNMVNGTNLATSCPSDALQYLSNIESFITPYVMCAPKTTIGDAKFTITTTELATGDSFSFNTWQLGPIWVDWGDGTVRRYNRTGTMNNHSVGFSHTYANAGVYQIKLSGAATGYHSSDNANYPAVSFKNNTKVAGIDGNILGVFPRLGTSVAQYPRFRETFSGCTNLTGNLPDHLFGTTNFAASNNMFNGMFNGCTSLTGWIPPTMVKNITSVTSSSMTNMFAGASGVGLVEECPTGYSQYITGYESYWSSKVSCVPDTPVSELGNPKFTVTTTNLDADTTFKFKLSAAGDFYVDWGDGSAVQHIVDPRTTAREYTHTYTTAGSYQIKFWGTATAYSTTDTVPAISFSYATYGNEWNTPTSNANELMIAGISGSLGALFPTIGTGAANGQQPRFYRTFAGATNMTSSIPSGLFTGITGAPATRMFQSLFHGCNSITGSIPAGLFSGLSGAPAHHLFYTTFSDCSGLTGSIDTDLFATISGAPAAYTFTLTFKGCSGLTGSIPGGLFRNIVGAPQDNLFGEMFNGCSGLTGPIPGNLFSGISGPAREYTFNSLFNDCTGLTGPIPENLFSGITGTATYLFQNTFRNCSGLSGYVPPKLFAGITTSSTNFMANIFNGSGLLTACPTGTIKYTTGFENYWNSKVSCTDGFITPFVLDNSDATTASVPTTIYAKFGIDWYSDANATIKFTQLATLPTKPGKIFNGYWTTASGTGTQVIDATGTIISNSTTTKLAKISDESVTLYPRWSDTYAVTYSCGDGTGTAPDAMVAVSGQTFTPAANTCSRDGYFLEGWRIGGTNTTNTGTPFTWNYTENKTFTASWTPAKFTITTIDMPANTTFSFKMSAKGEFRVDWGDGSPIETITRSSATSAGTYTHTYTTGGVKQIMFDGLATGYYSSSSYNSDAYSAISFYNNTNIAQVSGSLGSIFPSLSTTSTSASYQPRFMFTFNNCTNLTDIPSNLFSGITKPATGMFYYTFAGTTSLYQIPSGLFSSIVGAPQPHMFRRTFNGSGITGSIPGDLFSGISGAPATYMFSGTFAACPGLTGQLSSDLFSGISGEAAEAMYDVTFAGSSGLTGPIPSGFFGNIWGSAKPYMFTGVFLGCSNLTGSIPENLFGNITSASTQEFRQAFQNCSKLEGWVPPRLFASVSGTGILFMDEIFKGSGIVTECPSGYTQYITGFESYWNSKVSCTDGFMTPITLNDSSATTAADPGTMYLKYGFGFYSDVNGLNSLNQLTTLPTKTDYIFDGYWTSSNGGGTQVIDNTGAMIVNDTATKIAKITETGKTLYANWVKNYNVTYDCGEGTGTAPAPVVATSGKTFTPAANTCTREGYMFTGWAISGVSTGTNITNTMAPFTWNYTENKTFTAQWTEGPKFTITTINMPANTSFSFGMNVSGTFYVDWGDGTIQKLSTSTSWSGYTTYNHTYTSSGVKTINFAGLATGYTTNSNIATGYGLSIYFTNNTNIAKVSGSLGAMFPTLPGTSSYSTNPRFVSAFAGCTNLTEIPATLFSGVTRPFQAMFHNTFNGCTSLTSIPETLFSGISGAPAESMFQNTFANTGLTSIPATLFSTIQGAPATSVFLETFSGCTGLQSLPSGLFSGISGTPANNMYYQTFYGCTGLQSLPSGLFSGISGTPANNMYYQTFYGCTGLTGSIPNRFFGNLSGTLSYNGKAFYQAFYNDSNLSGYVPTDLFAGLSYASSSTNNILNNIFYGTNLEESCPTGMQQYYTGFENYFDGKVACTTAKTPAQMGDEKFTITTTNLSANSEFAIKIGAGGEFLIDCGNTINGEPQYIYITDGRTTQRTYYCDYPTAGSYQIKLYGTATGYDPNTYNYDNQYYPAIGFGNTAQIAGIAGSLGALFPTIGNGNTNGQQPRFNHTFDGAENMTGTIPENLFNGIIGTPTKYMFNYTFGGCSKLSGSIPENLFSGLTDSVSDYNGHYFYGTFGNCKNLTGYVPANLFRMSTSYMTNSNNMGNIFYGSGLLDKCPAGTKKYTTGFESNWRLDNNYTRYAIACEPGIDENDAMFGIGTTELDEGDTFSFTMSAAGTFFVDWGDDTVDKIERNNTTPTTYSHTYEKTSYYTITFVNDGVTAYSSDLITPAISFAGNTKIAAIRGSLAELMPTITVAGKPQQPRFYQTFKDCTNLEYIEDFDRLFDRIDSQYHATKPIINGQPVSHMFEGLFMGCTALEAKIPEDLFAAISGTPTIGLFAHTFEGCTGLYDEIPGNLFATISGAPAISMFEGTFKGCTGLEGNIPENLFAGISGNPAERMFMETFDGCSNLEGYIYPNTFAEISTVNVANMMTNVFHDSGLDTECPSGMQQYTTGFEEWFTGKVSCDEHQSAAVPEMNYEVFFVELNNVTPGSTFSFDLSATGEFEVYWGDGNTDHIIRTNTTPTTYTHTYTENTNGVQIRFSSAVTGYSTDETTPAISFAKESNTSGISGIYAWGSLMKLFPVLGTANGQIPRFYHTFYGLTNLDSVDWGMFNPNYLSYDDDPIITNLPFASHMFDGMFANCTNLGLNNYNESSSLFNNLFYYFDGTPAPYTFANMFSGTENLLGYISPSMFFNITGTATNMMQNIFAGSGIDTECPSGMNQYITGFESNWSGKVSCQTRDDLPSIYLYTTNMNAGSVFNFSLSATGRFAVNWGDESDVQWIDRNNTTPTTYSHTYTSSGNYYVYIYGLATGYSTNETTAAISFANNTFISSINESQDGSLGLMFPTIGDGTTNGQQPRFYRMFYNCTNLNDSYVSFTGNSEWEGLSSGIHGTPSSHMFDGLFENCTNMGTPSQDLFSRTENDYYGTAAPKYGISGAPAPYVFANTFKNTNISSFYPQWFSGLSGAPASHMFDSTFDGASNLYIYLGKNNNSSMFKNIVGAPAAYMFANTFRGTDMEGSPDGLFSEIRGAPAEGMFMGTFESTHISQIPEDLFAGVIGAPAAHMFDSTFAECQSLSDDYLSPALFVNISGTAAPYMFAGTFAGCNIGGNLPSMFAGITGSAAHMFEATFAGTNNLIGYIQPSMFAGITGTATDMMTDIFDESGIVTECPSGTTQYTTGFESWFDERVSCVPTAADFEVRAGIQTTPMPANTTFSFIMSAKGTFYVDWGDGSAVETITRNNTTPTTYSHTYTNASGQKGWRIAFGGVAIGYSTDDTTAAISFANNQYVAYPFNIGHLFPTLGTGNGNQPRFYRTFYNCTNMVGNMKGLLTLCSTKETVGGDGSGSSTLKMASNRKRVASSGAHSTTTATRSASLKRQRATNDAYHNDDYDACTGIFDGVYGQPVSHMFDGTFEGCTGLTGEIPNSLFVTISGTPVPYVFANTFKNCTGISGEIPKDLFGGLYGAPAAHMFESTFENDTNLTGTIPTSLFSSRSVSSTTGSVSNGSGGDSGDIKKASIKRTAMVSRGAVLRREGQTGGASNTISLTNGTFNGIEGAPAAYMFSKTFKGCTNLTGAIPAGLFSGISGAPAEYMFEETFAGCTGIDTIPACLFGGISGAPAAGMYKGTFDGCSNAEWEYTPGATHNISSVSTGTNIPVEQEFASNLKRGASLTRGAVAGSTLGKITNATKKVNTLREAVMGGLTRGGIIRSAGLRSNTTTTDNANAMPSLFGQFTGAAAAHMFENTFRGCAKLSGYVPPKMFEGITGVATDMMTDEFDNSGIATSCPAGYSTATTGFESWWDGRVACEYVGQICVYEEGSANPYKCADGCGWASKLMMYNESWNEFGGFPGYPLMSENVTDHSINISNGTTTCYLPIAENTDWGLHVKWNDKIWHAMFAQMDADENGTWGYCTGTYQDNYDGSCTTNSDCDWLYDENYPSACYQGTCALYNSYGNCYYIMGDTNSLCISQNVA